VLVDEFQDTSKAQFSLVTSLGAHGGVTVVGDDDQTIFGFNGSNHENFDLFRSHYPAFTELRLQVAIVERGGERKTGESK